MSEIQPAIKLVIPERIRKFFKGGEIFLRKWAIELPLVLSSSKTARDFKFQIMNERNNFTI